MKIRIALVGDRKNRTPLAYGAYRKEACPYFDFVDKENEADVLVFSCLKDIREKTDLLIRLKNQKSLPKLVVISEEPFWDLIWEEDSFGTKVQLESGDFIDQIHVVNHFNSDLFNFEKIPYFITTDDIYWSRYQENFKRNALYSCSDWEKIWSNASNKAAFYLEKRLNPKFDKAFPDRDIYGLCRYRSLLAQTFSHPGTLRVGLGWGSKKRQTLPDWHQEKLEAIDRKSNFISALENTHHPDYVTEKIFDAYACGGIPLYWASEDHRVKEIVKTNSFINLFGVAIDDACAKIENFKALDYVDRYHSSQQILARLFSEKETMYKERSRLILCLNDILLKILDRGSLSRIWSPISVLENFFKS